MKVSEGPSCSYNYGGDNLQMSNLQNVCLCVYVCVYVLLHVWHMVHVLILCACVTRVSACLTCLHACYVRICITGCCFPCSTTALPAVAVVIIGHSGHHREPALQLQLKPNNLLFKTQR